MQLKSLKTVFCLFLILVSSVNKPEAKETIVLQLRWDHQFQFAGYYAAEMMGYFNDAGFEVQIKSAITKSKKILKATEEVLSGRADFGVGAADVIIANQANHKLRVVASIFQQSAARLYTKSEKWPVSLAELAKSYHVARIEGDLIDVEFQAMLRKEGIDPAIIKPYEHRPSLSHLINGQVDVVPGYSLAIPFLAAQKNIKLAEINPNNYGVDFYGDSLFTGIGLIHKHPELVADFVAASLKGWHYALENPDAVIEYITKNYEQGHKFDQRVEFNRFQAKYVPEMMDSSVVEPGHINPLRWKKMHLALRDAGLITDDFRAEELIWVPGIELQRAKQLFLQRSTIVALISALLALVIILLVLLKMRQQDKALRQSERKYRIIFDEAAHGSLAVGAETGVILECNQKFAEMIGRKVQDIVGQPQRLLHPHITAPGELTENFKAHAGPMDGEILVDQLLKGDGSLLDVEIQARTIEIDGQRIVHGFFYDISEQKLNERLQAAQLRLIDFASQHSIKELLQKFLDEAEVLTASQIGFYHYVEDDQETLSLQTWSTNTLTHMCAANAPEGHYPISQAGVWVDCVREKKAVVHNDYASLAHRKGLPEGHAPVTRQLVVPVFREEKIVAIFGLGNKPVDYNDSDVLMVQRLADFSWESVVRKHAEEGLLRNQYALAKAQEIGHIGTWELDIINRKFVLTEETYRIFGAPLGTDISVEMFIDFVHVDDREFVRQQWAAALTGKPYDLEHRISVEGETRWIREKADISFDEQGQAISAIGVSQDITNYKKLMDEHRRSAQLAALGTVAAGVAHEINNPIQGIMSFAGLIKMVPENQEKVTDIAQKIIMESQRIANITKSMLYYSKDNVVGMVASEIRGIIEGALTLIKNKAKRQNVVVEASFADNLPMITVHPQGVQQIVINLVDNALDAVRAKEMPSEGEVITVCVDYLKSEHSACICLEVCDQGVGMSEPVLQRAKEAFFSTKPSAQGTGLGLSIVNDIIAKHAGQFDIESVEGQYTKMRVLLPVSSQREE